MILQITNEDSKYNLMPTTTIEEITQNIKLILSTIKGTAPLSRNLGLNISFIDDPTKRAFMKAKIIILEAIKLFEPRVEVLKVELSEKDSNLVDGKMNIKVEVKVLDEYI